MWKLRALRIFYDRELLNQVSYHGSFPRRLRSRYILLSLRSRLEEMVQICDPKGEGICVIVANNFRPYSRGVARKSVSALEAIDALVGVWP